MTNPGYVCKRKRKRDAALIGHIFGGTVEMAGIFGLGGDNQKGPLLAQQDQVYQNGNIPAENPLAAIFNPGKPSESPTSRPLNFPMASPKLAGGQQPSFQLPLGPGPQHKNS